MIVNLTNGAGFSDSAFQEVRRILASLPPEPEKKPARQRMGQGRRPVVLVILDGRKLKALRVRRGFPTLASLAAAARISLPHLSHAADYGELSQEAAMRLAAALQCSLPEIVFGAGYRTGEHQAWRNR